MVRISVVTVSDRVSQGVRSDMSGPLAVELLSDYGQIVTHITVADGEESVRQAIHDAASAGANVVFTTGGTGVTERDQTPEGTLPLIKKRLLGVEHLLRNDPDVAYAALSRGVAGIAEVAGNTVFVVNAPGSQGGVRDAVNAVGPLLEHLVDQTRGGDHHEQATFTVQNRGRSDGGDAQVVISGVSAEPIDMQTLLDAVDDDSAGAVTSFCGQVRNHDLARPVVAIDYEGHPNAGEVVKQIAQELSAGAGACKIAVLHRTGHLKVGDVALGAAVSASHRKEAFRVLEALIEEVKMRLPVWKCQYFADGTSEWTGAA